MKRILIVVFIIFAIVLCSCDKSNIKEGTDISDSAVEINVVNSVNKIYLHETYFDSKLLHITLRTVEDNPDIAKICECTLMCNGVQLPPLIYKSNNKDGNAYLLFGTVYDFPDDCKIELYFADDEKSVDITEHILQNFNQKYLPLDVSETIDGVKFDFKNYSESSKYGFIEFITDSELKNTGITFDVIDQNGKSVYELVQITSEQSTNKLGLLLSNKIIDVEGKRILKITDSQNEVYEIELN